MAVLRGPRHRQEPTKHDGPQKRARKAKGGPAAARAGGGACGTHPATRARSPALRRCPERAAPCPSIAAPEPRPGGVKQAATVATGTTKTITIQPAPKPRTLPHWKRRKAKDDEER